MKDIAVVGAGIVGICSAYFLQKSGFKVTIIDKEDPGTMTSYGHACSFADYANVPVNSPALFSEIPSMLIRKDGPLAIDFLYLIKNLPWAIQFLKNCKQDKVNEIASSLTNLLKHSHLSYEEIFKEVKVDEFISNEENLYLFHSKKSFQDYEYANKIRKKNNVKVRNLKKEEIKELEPNIADVYYAGQIFQGSRHTTNPLAISQKIFREFLSLGGKYIKENVKNIISKETKIGISLENKNYEFCKVIICAGAWSNNIAKMIGDEFPLDTERGYHILFETNKEKLINRPVAWSESGFYLIQIHNGIRAAGTVEIAGLKKPPNRKRLQMIERQSRKVLPQLGSIKSTWMGRRPTLPDSLPIIGKSTKNENVIYAFGHQHIGWTLGAVTGKIVDSISRDLTPNIDISAYSPSRF
ncbi:FAD-binding oxidoreductase [Pelagibacteraceae bacterium]|nr:FAD-binding oxidoreductase [Pelagibacteraceae bacterium]